jgi:Astacin (Peptidase family M12A)
MTEHVHTPLCCTPKGLDPSTRLIAAENAIAINPLNRAPVERLMKLIPGLAVSHPYISVLTSKRWRTDGVDLSVSFLDNPAQDLRERILGHMNAWSKTAKIKFRETNGEGDVRIARQGGEDGGYWSYLGTDVMLIDAGQPTMNLEAFTMDTPDSEFYRVVRHETGHTLGFPHEHMRGELIAKINREKAIKYFMATQGWSREEVIAQVLTPLEESSLFGTPHADPKSIMCYQIEAALTVDGQPILGGDDIDQSDYEFAAACYPK